jgi:hypothetical protein
MEIFGKHIFGSDAEQFLKLCKEDKKKWIAKYTTQKNESIIDEFINSPNISKDCKCLNCGKHGDKSVGISKEIAESTESISTSRLDTKNSVKRQRKSKTKKD